MAGKGSGEGGNGREREISERLARQAQRPSWLFHTRVSVCWATFLLSLGGETSEREEEEVTKSERGWGTGAAKVLLFRLGVSACLGPGGQTAEEAFELVRGVALAGSRIQYGGGGVHRGAWPRIPGRR